MVRVSFTPENATRNEKIVQTIEIPVESASEPGKKYYVSVTASCQCASFIYRNKCRHIHEVLDAILPRPDVMDS